MLRNVLRMGRHHVNTFLNHGRNIIQICFYFRHRTQIHQRVVTLSANTLAMHDLHPTDVAKQFIVVPENASIAGK